MCVCVCVCVCVRVCVCVTDPSTNALIHCDSPELRKPLTEEEMAKHAEQRAKERARREQDPYYIRSTYPPYCLGSCLA